MYLKLYKLLLPDVVASQSSLDKALDLANDLFNAAIGRASRHGGIGGLGIAPDLD
jgi:hypothetical protein